MNSTQRTINDCKNPSEEKKTKVQIKAFSTFYIITSLFPLDQECLEKLGITYMVWSAGYILYILSPISQRKKDCQ